MSYKIYQGSCLGIMSSMEAESVDSIVTDPPYGLAFMGKEWDHGVPGALFWEEALHVAKPGAFLLAFGGTRTFHRLTCAIEDAGWEIRDCIGWIYGSGFPKSLDVSKAIDKAAGAERVKTTPRGRIGTNKTRVEQGYRPNEVAPSYNDAGPVTPEAKQWQGWGTALKPAWEPIIVARKPFKGTVANNVLKYGTGGLNIDGCRVGTEKRFNASAKPNDIYGQFAGKETTGRFITGRWPANIIHDGSDEVLEVFPDNKGSAARFFYCAKASKKDREEGLDAMTPAPRVNGNKWTDQDYRVTSGERPPSAESGPRKNIHPTAKPTKLMQYLCRLVTQPGGVVLDPFMGSGSTGKAALKEGMRFIGIELYENYFQIAKQRIEAADVQTDKSTLNEGEK